MIGEIPGQPPNIAGSHSALASGYEIMVASEGPAAAWAGAVGNIGAYSDFFPGVEPTTTVPGSLTGNYKLVISEGHSEAQAERAKYKFRFYSATCYMRILWDEVVYEMKGGLPYDPYTPTEVSRTAKEFVWSPPSNAGLCLPEDFDEADDATWPETDEYTVDEQEPGNPPVPEPEEGEPESANIFYVYVKIENLRYSCLEGCEPPEDGSANGFPAL